MSLSDDQVRRLARLARIALQAEETSAAAERLNRVLGRAENTCSDVVSESARTYGDVFALHELWTAPETAHGHGYPVAAIAAWVERAWSVSSIRSRNLPPRLDGKVVLTNTTTEADQQRLASLGEVERSNLDQHLAELLAHRRQHHDLVAPLELRRANDDAAVSSNLPTRHEERDRVAGGEHAGAGGPDRQQGDDDQGEEDAGRAGPGGCGPARPRPSTSPGSRARFPLKP